MAWAPSKACQSLPQITADAEVRQKLQETFYFQPNPSIRHVITIGTPFGGGIVAYILLMESIPAALYSIGTVGQDGGSTWMDKLFIFSPITSLIGGSYWFFGQTLDSADFQGTLTSAGYLWASIASGCCDWAPIRVDRAAGSRSRYASL